MDSPLASSAAADDPENIRRERDFYRSLLDLGRRKEVEPFLEEALALVVEIAGARRGYIEISDPSSGAAPAFWMARGCYDEEVAQIREALSSGVIGEAMATGQTVAVQSALDDPRFRKRGSVRKNRIEAVICAPIGDTPPLGVVYLQDRLSPEPFSEEDRGRVETFARLVAPFAARLLAERRRQQEEDPTRPLREKLRAEGLIGRSRPLAEVLRLVSLVAPLDICVLLTGESGTGKTELARIIHDNSPRRAGPLIELNCAALPDGLVESELFGALPGAHSTARQRIDGKITAANGGTLFLDEVGELRLPAQAKLLQFLQSREYFPLGASKPLRADVRVVAATNADLAAAVKRREFREDLFYRLQVLPVRLPSLEERREDIRPLLDHFCEKTSGAFGFPRITPSEGLVHAAEVAEWPGNIRQLGHAMQAAIIRAAAEGAREVGRPHLFPDVDGSPAGEDLTYQEATRRFQRDFLRRALERADWNITEVASRLDLARSHVYKLIELHGLSRGR